MALINCCKIILSRRTISSSRSINSDLRISNFVKYSTMSVKTVNKEPQNIFIFDEVSSTMDKAREILNKPSTSIGGTERFAVIAKSQSVGRGTRGRLWDSATGNLFLTVVFKIRDVKIPLTLVPLRIGSIIWRNILVSVDSSKEVRLKWPNDILVDKKKISGVLIEMERDCIIVGIGVNVTHSPAVILTGSDGGRPATSIVENLSDGVLDDNAANILGNKIFNDISEWLDSNDTSENVLADVEYCLDKSLQTLRPPLLSNDQSSGEILRQEIIPLRLNPDGSLLVRYLESGKEDLLYTEYLW